MASAVVLAMSAPYVEVRCGMTILYIFIFQYVSELTCSSLIFFNIFGLREIDQLFTHRLIAAFFFLYHVRLESNQLAKKEFLLTLRGCACASMSEK